LISIYKKALETAREDQMKSILALKQRYVIFIDT